MRRIKIFGLSLVVILLLVSTANAAPPVGQWECYFYDDNSALALVDSLWAIQDICFQAGGTWYGTGWSGDGWWYRKGLSNQIKVHGKDASWVSWHDQWMDLQLIAFGRMAGTAGVYCADIGAGGCDHNDNFYQAYCYYQGSTCAPAAMSIDPSRSDPGLE